MIPENEPSLPKTGAEAFRPAAEKTAPLPPPVQEHLAQQLRAAYQETTEKPAFLGDTALPPEIEHTVERIAERERAIVREKAHELGTEAVEAALEEVVAGARRERGSQPLPEGEVETAKPSG
ncbi:MAG: hypothetical protein ACJ8C3_08890 [Microvirga sp.]